MSKLTRYKDTLVHPHSELARLIAEGDMKKVEAHYQRISREAIERGEFLPPNKEKKQ
jgi:hypothetical protein